MKQVPVESAKEERIKSPRGLFYTNNNNKKEEKRDVVGINRKIKLCMRVKNIYP